MQSDLTVTPAATSAASRLGLHGDRDAVVSQLCKMGRQSAPFTHRFGNRRYDNFVLDVRDGVILNVAHIFERPRRVAS